MRVTSTSKTPCTCALVRFDMTMCSAIFLRITDMGTTSPGVTPPTGCSGAVTAGMRRSRRLQQQPEQQAERPERELAPQRERLLPCLAMNASMSSLVMRPPRPVPGTLRQVDVVLFGDACAPAGWSERDPARRLRRSPDLALLLALQAFLLVFGKISGNVLRLRLFSLRRLRGLGLRGLRLPSPRRRRGLRAGSRGCTGCVAFSGNGADDGVHLHGSCRPGP